MARKGWSLLTVGLLVVIPRLLFAQSSAVDSAEAQARPHSERAVPPSREGSSSAALAESTRAYELNHDYRLLVNIAQLESERQDYVRAIEALGEYLRLGGEAITKEQRLAVDHQIARWRARIGELWMSGTAGADVWIGSHRVATLPLSAPILVNTGRCVVRVVRAGYKADTRELAIVAGERAHLESDLEPETQPPVAPVLVRDNTRLWLSLAATGGAAAGASVFGLLTKKADEQLYDRISSVPSDTRNIDSARSTVRTDAIICDILLAATAVSAVASVYFFLHPKYRTPAEQYANAQRPTARLVPSPTGVFVKGTF